MKKKQQKIQIALISIGLLLIISTYFYYPYMNRIKLLKDQPAEKNLEKTPDNAKSTSFEEIQYEGLTADMQKFSIRSESAYILDEDPDLMFMKAVMVEIYLSDGRTVTIVSDIGKFHKRSQNLWFEKNVVADDGETKIFAENLDLLATKNSVNIYNNVRLNSPAAALQADKIDYDFETKHFKVSMFDDNAVSMKVIK